jgi:hypothetical protein
MRPPRYPLEPLAELRGARVGEAKGRLAEASRAREAARQARLGTESLLGGHERAAAGVRRAESEALEKGKLSAGDLARGAEWAVREAAERGALVASVQRAAQVEAAATEAERVARSTLASRKSEAEVVAKDSARWRAGQRKKAENREEQDVSEAWRPKR